LDGLEKVNRQVYIPSFCYSFGEKEGFWDDEEKQERGCWEVLYSLKAVNAWHVGLVIAKPCRPP
jgi:hypothetical protein